MKILWQLAWRNVARRKARSLTIALSVAVAVFLVATIDSFGNGFERTLDEASDSNTLIVFRENRYCPQTSRLPERYGAPIAAIPGVERVVPQRVHLNNCRANLDAVLFLGTDPSAVLGAESGFRIESGSGDAFQRDRGAAFVGRGFAKRRGLSCGDALRLGPIEVRVAAIFAATDSHYDDVVFTHLDFLQRALDRGATGTVTQFEVEVAARSDPTVVAAEIDARFATDESPTKTFRRAEFLKRATGELLDLVTFARRFGAVTVFVLFVLLANASVLAAAERRAEHALLLAVGYRSEHVVITVLAEAALLALFGALLGAAAAFAATAWSRVTVGIEGVAISALPTLSILGLAAVQAILAGCAGALVPARLAARTDVATVLRGG